MPCYRPWSPSQKMAENFERLGKRVERLPCGRCIGCRLDRAAAWSIRCVHEASLYDSSSFVTLTYDDDHLPADRSLSVRDLQLFMKRVRKRVRGVSPGRNGDFPIRFFAAGEYGSKTDRPHYHLLLFNVDFADRVAVGKRLFESKLLKSLWTFGHSSFGSVTPASAAYVAQYSLKKVYGRVAGEMRYLDPVTGSVRTPEFCTMSRKPGIGAWWYEAFRHDILPRDYVVVGGRKVRVPRFYSSRFEAENPEAFGRVKEAREEKVLALTDRSPARLVAAEQIALAKLSTYSSRDL